DSRRDRVPAVTLLSRHAADPLRQAGSDPSCVQSGVTRSRKPVSTMSNTSLTPTALAAAILAAPSVLVCSLTAHLFVWAAFIGWASYDHSGATTQAAVRSSAALVFGVIMAWAVAAAAPSGMIPLNATVATAACAGIASFFIVLAARASILSVVPATFYGFASTFAYLS